MAADIIQTRQKEYVNSMSALLSVFAGGLLRKFAVKQEALVGEEIYFYKSSGGSSTRNTRNMFVSSYTGQGGKIEAIKVEPDYILWDVMENEVRCKVRIGKTWGKSNCCR